VGFKPRIPEFKMLDAAYASIEECKRGQMHPPPYIFIPNSSFLATVMKRGEKNINIFETIIWVV